MSIKSSSGFIMCIFNILMNSMKTFRIVFDPTVNFSPHRSWAGISRNDSAISEPVDNESRIYLKKTAVLKQYFYIYFKLYFLESLSFFSSKF